jgi:hypothetical protein
MISLDVATDRLLHKASYRKAFLDGNYAHLDVHADDLAALLPLDREQLIETAEAVRRSLLDRKHRGSGGIQATFPETLSAWLEAEDDPDMKHFADRFMESAAFDAYREVPHSGVGLSLEEATFRFFESEQVGDPRTREREFLAGLCKALALNTEPAFSVGAPLRQVPSGWYAVSRHEPVSLFAALRGSYVQGELTPFLADLLTSGRSAEQVGEQYGVPSAVVDAATAKLEALGLVL